MRFVIEILIYEIIDMNESVKNIEDKEFESVDERVLKEKRFLI